MITRRLFGQMLPAIPLVASTIAEEVGLRLGGGLSKGVGLNTAMNQTEKYYGNPRECSPGNETDWMKERLTHEMKRLADFDKSQDRELWQRQWHGVEARRLDGMRSVSPGQKARMMTEWTESQSRKEYRGYIEREIAELKTQLGPLALLL
jgi:hypothetical protein